MFNICFFLLLLTPFAAFAQPTVTRSQIQQLIEMKNQLKAKTGYKEIVVGKDQLHSVSTCIPDKITTHTQLNGFVVALQNELKIKYGNQVAGCTIPAAGERTSNSDAAILHLYQNDIGQAVLLALASVAELHNGAADYLRRINNLAAIMTETNHADVAVALLLYAVSIDPENVSILNNLGHAYARQKNDTEAETWLRKTVRTMSGHPNANLTLALMKETSSKEEAISFAKTSLKGGFTTKAYSLITKYDNTARLENLVGPRVKIVEYIEAKEPPVTPQPIDAETAGTLEKDYRATQGAIDHQIDYFDSVKNKILKKEGSLAPPSPKNAQAALQKKVAHATQQLNNIDKLMNGTGDVNSLRVINLASESEPDNFQMGFYHFPFSFFAFWMKFSLINSKQKDYDKPDVKPAFIEEARDGLVKQLQDEFATHANEWQNLPIDERCAAQDALKNSYLSKYAEILKEWQMKRWNILRDYVNRRLFWSIIEANDENDYQAKYYDVVSEFLVELEELQTHNWYLYGCKRTDPQYPGKSLDLDHLIPGAEKCPFEKLTITAGSSLNTIIFDCQKKATIKPDPGAITGCLVPSPKDIYAGTMTIGFDAALKNYVVIENGMIMDNSIRWDRTMAFDGATSKWWLNNGLNSYKNTNQKNKKP